MGGTVRSLDKCKRAFFVATLCGFLTACASGPDERDRQKGALFLNPTTDATQHLADIDACNMARDEEHPTGEQVGTAAAGLLLAGIPGLIAMAMINDETDARLYNTCMIEKGYQPISLNDQFAGRLSQDNGDDETKTLVPAVHDILTKEERTSWKAAVTTPNTDTYAQYLATYPAGVFSDEARIRLENLGAEQSAIGALTPENKVDADGNRVWHIRGQVTDGTYSGFCSTGQTFRGQVTEKEGALTGSIVDADGKKHTLRGVRRDHLFVIRMLGSFVLQASVGENPSVGKLYNTSTFWSDRCEGKFRIS